MIDFILFMVFIILVPAAFIALIAIYVLAKMSIAFIIERIEMVYRYASGKSKDNEHDLE